KRTGFLELLQMMDRGEVGIVIVQDLTRLSRMPVDIMSFLQTAENTGTLIYSNGAVRDPRSADVAQGFGLQLEGLFGSYDNRSRKRRLTAARIAKAQRGQAVTAPPIGYVRSVPGEWVKDPDREVQDAVARVFAGY